MEQLSGLDAMFIHAERQGLPMHISSFTVYDPSTSPKQPVGFQNILDLYDEKIRDHLPILRSRLIKPPFGVDQPYWQLDEEFDIESHIHHVSAPGNGSWDDLRELIADLHALPLDRDRPLWEAHVVENISSAMNVPEGCFGVFMKTHHSIMDGSTGMAIFSSLHSLAPEPQPIDRLNEEEVDPEHYELPSTLKILSRASWHNAQLSFRFVKLVKQAVDAYQRMKKGLDDHSIELMIDKPRTRFNEPISSHRVLDRFKVPFQDFRKIKKLVPDATINEVALTVIGGAMQRYLADKKELPRKTLVASVPIDVRPKDGHLERGNVLSIMNVVLHSDISDPIERLQAVHASSRQGKNFADALGPTLLNSLCDSLYAGVASWVASKVDDKVLSFLPPATHTLVTNVSGPPIPFYLAGCKLVDSFGLGPLIPGTGLFHTISSVQGEISISACSCRELMPDVDFYIRCMEESYSELFALTKPRRAPRKKTTQKKTTGSADGPKKARKSRATAKAHKQDKHSTEAELAETPPGESGDPTPSLH